MHCLFMTNWAGRVARYISVGPFYARGLMLQRWRYSMASPVSFLPSRRQSAGSPASPCCSRRRLIQPSSMLIPSQFPERYSQESRCGRLPRLLGLRQMSIVSVVYADGFRRLISLACRYALPSQLLGFHVSLLSLFERRSYAFCLLAGCCLLSQTWDERGGHEAACLALRARGCPQGCRYVGQLWALT